MYKYLVIFLILLSLFYLFNHMLNNYEFFNAQPKKIAIITSIYGGYEYLKTYENVLNKDLVDWYCFTDSARLTKSAPWKIITTPYHLLNTKNKSKYKNHFSGIKEEKVKNMMSAKYYKAVPHEIDILQGYDYFIWIDGNIKLRDNFIHNVMELFDQNQNANVFNFKHSQRDCVKDEVFFCKDWEKYRNQNLETQLNDYIDDGFDDSNGLYELTSFYRKNTPEINKIFDLWWIHNLKYSYQDQISYPYVFWKFNTKPDYVIHQNVFSNEDYCYVDEGHYNSKFEYK